VFSHLCKTRRFCRRQCVGICCSNVRDEGTREWSCEYTREIDGKGVNALRGIRGDRQRKKQSDSYAGSCGRAPTYRQPSWQFKAFPRLRIRITKPCLVYIVARKMMTHFLVKDF